MSDLADQIREIVRDVVRQELQVLRDTEIAPLRRAIEGTQARLDQRDQRDLNSLKNPNDKKDQKDQNYQKDPIRRIENEFELPPPVQDITHPRTNSSPAIPAFNSLFPTNSFSSHNSYGGAPPSPNLLQRVSSRVAQTTSSLLHNTPTSSLVGDDKNAVAKSPILTPSQSPNLEGSGPVTARRNSGVSRAVDSEYNNYSDLSVPRVLQEGIPVMRITHKKKVPRSISVDKDKGIIMWNTKLSSRLYIDRICEIYVGEEAHNYREELRISAEHSHHWATIIHQKPGETKLKALHLIIPHQQHFNSFITSLFKLVKFRREIMSGLALAGQHFVDVYWNLNSSLGPPSGGSTGSAGIGIGTAGTAGTTTVSTGSAGTGNRPPSFISDASVDLITTSLSFEDKRLSFYQVLKLSRQLHVHCSPDFIRQMFEEADKDHSRYLDFEEFKEFVRLLKRRSDIAAIYDQYKIGDSTANLVNFFQNVQREPLPSSLQLPLIEPVSVEEFGQLLHPTPSISNTGLSPDKLSEEETYLHLPLDNYFVSSSHNSYLMGRQIADGSSTESCIRTLQDGCRCIELDCWDGPSKSVVVYHGHSITRLTTSVVFGDVIDAVQKYAFISTPYPLILSLEIRCSEAAQLNIVSILRTTLAGVLVTEPIHGGDKQALPSPEELKHRILIKVKGATSGNDYSASSGDEGPSEGSQQQQQQQQQLPHIYDRNHNQSIIPELAELGVYFSGKRFPGLFTGTEPRNNVYSFNERTIRNMAKDGRKLADLKNYNQESFTRVYPAPYRLKSSNFNPIYYWKLGVQMVALNWQTFDLGMQLNTAMFSNRVGYVLKPAFLRERDFQSFTGSDEAVTLGPVRSISSSRMLNFTVISAQQLPRPKFLKESQPFSPYVVIEIYGLGSGESVIPPQWRTVAAYDNGFNPIWNYGFSVRLEPEDYEFASIRISVAAEGQTFAYHLCRISSALPGYRPVPLVDMQGEDFIFSSLFVKMTLT